MFIQNISNLRCALYGVLNYLGFQPDKVKWTNILYTGFEANVLINCHFSKPISISRGVHQGGPSSGLFFLTCDEFLTLNIKRIFHIKRNTSGRYPQTNRAIYGWFQQSILLAGMFDPNHMQFSSFSRLIQSCQKWQCWYQSYSGYLVITGSKV